MTFYPAQPLSPKTELDGELLIDDTTVTVADATKLPDAPNLCTIGEEEDAEVILYEGKNGNDLTTVTRGFEGDAKGWDSGTPVARYLTAHDLNRLEEAGLKDVANTWSKAQVGGVVALTDEATIAVDASLGNNFRVTLEGNRTLDNPTNLTDGWTFNIMVKQDATGSRTLAYGNKYAWAGGAPTLTTTASARDQITGIYWSTEDIIVCTIMKDVKVPS